MVNHAKDGEWAFDGEEHAQPEYYEDTADEAERSMAKWGTALPNSTGFVTGEGCFVYDPETKTVTLYAYDFCVFGFHFQQEKDTCGGICSWVELGGADPADPNVNIVYDFRANLKTTKGRRGRAVSTKYTVKMGKSADEVFWYRDPSISAKWSAYVTFDADGGIWLVLN